MSDKSVYHQGVENAANQALIQLAQNSNSGSRRASSAFGFTIKAVLITLGLVCLTYVVGLGALMFTAWVIHIFFMAMGITAYFF